MSRPIEFPGGPGLREFLFAQGVEFPCNGESQCGQCRVRLLRGDIPVTDAMRAVLRDEELAAGWRLGCEAEAAGPLTVAVEQWAPVILTDEAHVTHVPQPGLAVAVDLGTTTMVAQLLDRTTGEVLGVRTALNAQAQYGADVMTRIQQDLAHPGVLTRIVRAQIRELVLSLSEGAAVEETILVGNTAMHHLFCGLDVTPLAAVPFRPTETALWSRPAPDLGWPAQLGAVTFLPCVAGFVGSDLLVGLLEHDDAALLDLGTNGEIAAPSSSSLRCASTAAGPAFEAGRISKGMRASDGAIERVDIRDGSLHWHVIGGGAPRGLCGSGLVDAVAAALDLEWIDSRGRLKHPIDLGGVEVTQRDIRELQLAKAAIAAGLKLLLPRTGRIRLAGAFGNYVRIESARRIGLIPAGLPVEACGNTALRGARAMALAGPLRDMQLSALLTRLDHVELAADPAFQDCFAESMLLEPYLL